MKGAPLSLVNRYARSLFRVAEEKKVVDAVRTDLNNLARALSEHREFSLLLMNPGLGKTRLKALLDGLCDKLSAHQLTKQFTQLLLDKDRLLVLFNVNGEFERMWRDYQGLVEVTVITAVPIADELQKQITEHLAKRSGKQPIVAWTTDPRILGGVVIHWPDRVFDGSLARKLTGLQIRLAGQ